MTEHIKTRRAAGTFVVRAGGAILAETTAAIELSEGSYPSVMYIPRADIAMAFLDPSDTVTHCAHKGEATHYSIVAKSGVIKDAAWSYENPKDGLSDIAGHLAFYPDKVTVEQL